MSLEEVTEESKQSIEEDKNFRSTTPYNTFILLTCVLLVFATQLLIPIDDVVRMVGFDNGLFLGGEYWRILTSAVVHGGIAHIIFNGFALFMIGRLAELLSSKANVPIVFVLAAVGGSVLSLLFGPDIPSVGASGGIIGLLGYLTLYSYRRRKIISTRLFRDLVFNIGFIAVIGLFVIPNVDNWAHLGGLLVGLVYGVFEVPDDLYQDPRITSKLKNNISYVFLGIVVATSLAVIVMITARFLGYL